MQPCKVCKQPTTAFRHPRFEMLFHACPHCRLITKDEANYISLEEEYQIYEQHNNSPDSAGYLNYLTNFLDAAVLPHVKTGLALDFGSGPNPVLSQLLEKQGFEVTLYDYFYAPDTDYLTRTYDLITSTEVVEHIQQPMAAFETLASLLKPGGILSIMTLFHPDDQDDFCDWFYIRDPSHVSFFTPRTMQVMAALTGLVMIDTNHYRYVVMKKV